MSHQAGGDRGEKAIAVHEAGHAVMCCLRRLPLYGVSIRPTEGADGQTKGGGVNLYRADLFPTPESREEVEDHIRVSYAGYLAEKMFAGVDDEDGAAGDFQAAYALGSTRTEHPDELEAYLNWLMISARAELEMDYAREAVEEVARILMEEGVIEGEQVERIVRDSMMGRLTPGGSIE